MLCERHVNCALSLARRAFAPPAAPVETASSAAQPSYAGVADTYAVVEIGGHQLIVEEGRWYTVNRLEVRDGAGGASRGRRQGGECAAAAAVVWWSEDPHSCRAAAV